MGDSSNLYTAGNCYQLESLCGFHDRHTATPHDYDPVLHVFNLQTLSHCRLLSDIPFLHKLLGGKMDFPSLL